MNMITFRKLRFGSLVLGVLLFIGLTLPLQAIAEGSVSFPDPNLEAVIRETINKPSGDITLTDVQNITELDASYREITSIEGLQYLTNLEVLILYTNQIHDISPLKDLKKFKKLYLSDNPITDYSPIYDIYPTLPASDFTIDPSVLPSQSNQSSTQGSNTTENVSCGTKKNPTVIVEGKLLSFEIPPYLKDGATMVPIRAISDALGVKVQWDKKSSTITLAKNSTKILLTIGKRNATANGKSVKLDVPAEIVDGSTFVPLRFVSEALDAYVKWDKDAYTAKISWKKGGNNVVTVERKYAANGGLLESIYYLDGEEVASFSPGTGYSYCYGHGWSMKVAILILTTSYVPPGMNQTFLRSAECYSPELIRVNSGEKEYNVSDYDSWKKDSFIIENNLEPVISYIINEMDQGEMKLRSAGYR